jgi:hypothetical protein
VHAGNRIDALDRPHPRFPASQVDYVAERVGRLLDALQPRGVVSAPAAGADLIVLDEARRRAIPLHIVLPIEPEQFVRASVADHDEMWVGRFRAVLEHARIDPASSVLEIDRPADDDEWFREANRDVLARVSAIAGDELVLALTIRPPGGEIPHSVTDDFADHAGRAGFVVVSIDPRPGGVATR